MLRICSQVRSRLTGAHFVQAILHGLHVLMGMLLMLVFMSYNVWLCTAMVCYTKTWAIHPPVVGTLEILAFHSIVHNVSSST